MSSPSPIQKYIENASKFLMKYQTQIRFKQQNSANGRVILFRQDNLILKTVLNLEADLLHRDFIVQYVINKYLENDTYSPEHLYYSQKYFMACQGVCNAVSYQYYGSRNIEGLDFSLDSKSYYKFSLPCLISTAFQSSKTLYDILENTKGKTLKDKNDLIMLINELFEELYDLHASTGFVHNDLHATNILWNDTEKCFSVIDYGRAHVNIKQESDNDKALYDIFELYENSYLYRDLKGYYKQYYSNLTSYRDVFDNHCNVKEFIKAGRSAFWADLGGLALYVCKILNYDYDGILGDHGLNMRSITDQISKGSNINRINIEQLHKRKFFSSALKFILDIIYTLNNNYPSNIYIFGKDAKTSYLYESGVIWKSHFDQYKFLQKSSGIRTPPFTGGGPNINQMSQSLQSSRDNISIISRESGEAKQPDYPFTPSISEGDKKKYPEFMPGRSIMDVLQRVNVPEPHIGVGSQGPRVPVPVAGGAGQKNYVWLKSETRPRKIYVCKECGKRYINKSRARVWLSEIAGKYRYNGPW